MFRKRGNILHAGGHGGGQDLNYAAIVAAALREELGGTHQAVKTVMRWTGASERTIKNWLAGTSGPRGEHLVVLIRHSDHVLDTILRSADRTQSITAHRFLKARDLLARTVKQIDELMK